jgi:alanyl aminopeptidase
MLTCLAACQAEEQTSPENYSDDPFRLIADVRPVMQQLDLRIDPGQADYSGMTTITLELLSQQQELRLHAEELEISNLTLISGDAEIDVTFEHGEHDLLIVSPPAVLAAGTYELRVEFSNNFNTDGTGINRTEYDGRHYIFSQFEAIDARVAFPCFDEPGFKYPWQLTITVPEDVTAITNTPESSVTHQDGWTRTVFDATPALPSYLIAVAVGPFEMVPIDGMSIPGRVIVPHGQSSRAGFAVETTPPLLAYLEDYFGESYPFRKLDLIATFQSFSGAMEHPGAITYSDFFLLLDETASTEQKATLIKITAHELAHMWFGNLVTMQWWDDLWLNESFADWMGDKTVEAVYPEYGGDLSELRTTFFVMNTDARPTTRPIRHEFKSTDNFEDGVFLAYYKGKVVLGMFEHAVGFDIFRKGVIRYLHEFHRGNATATDLWASINAGTEIDLAGGLASFIDQPGIPLVTVAALGDGRYEFSQSRLSTGNIDSDNAQSWIITVTYTHPTADGLATGELILSKQSEVVDLGADVAWILPNADQRGYYRWNVPTEMLTELGAQAAAHLNIRERMGLLTNLWALLATDKIDADDFLAAIRGVSSDTDPSVISALLDQLNSVRQTFIAPELRNDFAKYVQALLTPTFERIGTEAIPGEGAATASLRPQVMLWLADYGRDERARAVNRDLTRRFLAGEIPSSSQVSVSMRAEARRGDMQLFYQYRERFEAAKSPGDKRRLSQAIGSFRSPDVVKKVLDYTLNGPLQTIEIGEVFRRLAGWPDNNALLLNWLMQHDATLRQRLPEGMMARIPDLMTVCSEDNLETLLDFYGAPERSVPGIDSELKDSKAEVLECAALRQRELESVSNYLQGGAFL